MKMDNNREYKCNKRIKMDDTEDLTQVDESEKITYTIGFNNHIKVIVNGNDVIYQGIIDVGKLLRIEYNIIDHSSILSTWDDENQKFVKSDD